jgi:hypothetical protein
VSAEEKVGVWKNRVNEVYFAGCWKKQGLSLANSGAGLVPPARTGNCEMKKIVGLARMGMGLFLGSLAGIFLGGLVGMGIALLFGVI